MSVKNVKVLINETDVSHWVLSCGLIPIVNRNRDWSPVFEGFRLVIQSNCPYTPVKNDEIVITLNDEDIYLGYIHKRNFIYRPETTSYGWHLEIKHWLVQLERFDLSKTTFNNGDEFVKETTNWGAEQEFTVNGFNRIVDTGHGLTNGTRIVFRSSGTLPTPLKPNHRYYVMEHNADEFYVIEHPCDYIEFTAWNEAGYTGYVNINSATGSGTHFYSTNCDLTKYNDFSFYRDLHYIKTGPSYAFFSDFWPGHTWFPHFPFDSGSPHPTRYSIVMFDNEGGTLPGGLANNRGYFANYYDDANPFFLIYNTRSLYLAGTYIETSSDGTGDQWYSIVKRVDGSNITRYPTGIIQLKHFVETVFNLIGVELDTSEIDNIIFYRYITEFQSYKWTDIYFMESILYNINQSEPGSPDDDLEPTQIISLIEFIQDLFSRLGIVIKLDDASTKTYKLYSQKRNSVGVIQPQNEDIWTIADKDQLNYSDDEIIDDQQGWYFDRELRQFAHNLFIVGSGLTWFYNEKLSTKNTSIYQEKFAKYIQEEEGAKRHIISFYKNLVFFFRDLFEDRGPNNVYHIRNGSLGKEFLEFGYSTIPYSPHINQKQALLNHSREEIEFRAELFTQNIWTVKEIYLDIKNYKIILVQEVNQLTSG